MVVTVGVCCMDVKLFSRPMAAILNRLRRYEDLTIVPFGNRCVFNKPVESWPIVDFLICFSSAGFPLAKAEDYVRLRNPICFNDVLSQYLLLDRTAVYDILQKNGIPVPPYQVFTDTDPERRMTDTRRMLMELHNEDPTPEELLALNAQPSEYNEDDSEDAARRQEHWGSDDRLQENEDCIVVNGHRFRKPFVEKPVFAEDHNIYIYYPKSVGGGSKRLFRKIGDRSSRFYPRVSTVRRRGSFIYEEFVSTDGADIKVYTVGPDYAHAEARKAPTVDGRVKRTADGKEVRYHVILTQQEKEIARKITQIFGQNVCGFDILRSDGITYVCDVNGWSFVKGSPKYYSDCAQILYEMIQFHLHPVPTSGLSRASRLLQENDGLRELSTEGGCSESGPIVGDKQQQGIAGGAREMRCLLAVIRHGDRTPKQKVKVKVTHPLLLQFFDGVRAGLQPSSPLPSQVMTPAPFGSSMGQLPAHPKQLQQVKLKSAKEMELFTAAVAAILQEDSSRAADSPARDSTCRPKYLPLSRPDSPFAFGGSSPVPVVPVPSLWGALPPLPLPPPTVPISPGSPHGSNPSASALDANARQALREIYDVLCENAHFSGINRKVQLKPLQRAGEDGPDGQARVTKALLIFKYGGQLTEYGLKQADWLGKRFRQKMYPADRIGMLSLHSSFAHDIKFYASDEGRVQMTAAVFARAFLELDEEEIIPILYALVWNDKRANQLLEHSCSDSESMIKAKRQLAEIMNADVDFSSPELHPSMTIGGLTVADLRKLNVSSLGNPYRRLHSLHQTMQSLCDDLRAKVMKLNAGSPRTQQELAGSPPPLLPPKPQPESMRPRQLSVPLLPPATVAVALPRILKLWSKLTASFYDEHTQRFDISKVPEVADCSRHDALHHRGLSSHFRAVYDAVLPLSMWVVPQEYGVTPDSKVHIATEVVKPLVEKIVSDLRQMRERRQLQTVSRFYFTSESHLNSLYNYLEHRLGLPFSATRDEGYVAHFVFKLFEDLTVPVGDARRFRVELWHSAGSNAINLQDPPGTLHTFTLPLKPIALNLSLDEFIRLFNDSR